MRSTGRGGLCGHCGEVVADEGMCDCTLYPAAAITHAVDEVLFLQVEADETGSPTTTVSQTEAEIFMINWDALVDTMRQIRIAKQNDYTGGEGPLANYDATAEFLDTTTELVMLGRLHEKMVRVRNLLGDTDQMVLDERIEDTLLDIANIALLIGASLLTKEQLDA